jgi:hypothetical protein
VRQRILTPRWAAVLTLSLLAAWAGCQSQPKEAAPEPAVQAPVATEAPAPALSYVCPMHADQTSPTLAKCGVCGMDMVEAAPAAADTTAAQAQ